MILLEWDYIAKKGKEPVACIHVDSDILHTHVLEEISNMFHLQKLQDLTVLEHSWYPWLIYVSHFIVLNERNKKPEGYLFWTMQK